MLPRLLAAIFFPFVLLVQFGPGWAASVHHDLQVTLIPHEQRLDVQDVITLPRGGPDTIHFRLHEGLAPRLVSPEGRMAMAGKQGRAEIYTIDLPPGSRRLVLRFGGYLHHALEAREKGYARGIRQTPGQISADGVYLTAGSLWYPQFTDELLTFSMKVTLPENWRAISQGNRISQIPGEVTWVIDAPQEQIFLVAGPFTEYTAAAGRVRAMVFLRRPEPDLAQAYLSATEGTIAMYEQLIGRYPYTKFALVENFWETGFGMPSFTLLGPKVIRLPFILHTSYPHEILHNWWGNSVYPRYEGGNWAEGLTAYLADHLFQEQRGRAADYRQTVLQKYADYVSVEKDFPLTDFSARHSAAGEAIGYGKALMFFHMLRRRLGDDTFIAALRAFYEKNRFDKAGFEDLREAFEKAAEAPLETMFAQWVERAGAPRLSIGKAQVQPVGDGYALKFTLRQAQPDPPYALRVPVAVTLAGEPTARMVVIPLLKREEAVTLQFDKRPLRLDADPRYDIFRKLNPAEIPPALSGIYGAERVTVVLPADAASKRLSAYRAFAEALAQAGPEKVDLVLDRDLDQLPSGHDVVLLGWDNRFRQAAADELSDYGAMAGSSGASLNGQSVPRPGHSVAVAVRHPQHPRRVLAWIAADPPRALEGLARKLPHYHSYSYLAFSGPGPENIIKGRWPVIDSPLTLFLAGQRPAMGRLPQERPLHKGID